VTEATTAGQFRIYGVVGTDRPVYRLYDRSGERAVWAWLSEPVEQTLYPGMLLDGTLTRDEEGHLLEAWQVRSEHSLAVGRTRAALPEAVLDAWRRRPEGHRRTATVVSGPCEVHVSAPPSRVAPEAVFERMVTGGYSFERWFEGLVALDAPATHLTVVFPADRSVFVFFATPDSGSIDSVRCRRERFGLRIDD
jgi:hypothetical protein